MMCSSKRKKGRGQLIMKSKKLKGRCAILFPSMVEPLLLQEEPKSASFYRRIRWWLTHRASLRRLALFAWALFDVGLILFSCQILFDAFLGPSSLGEEQAVIALASAQGQSQRHAFVRAHAARPLVSGDPLLFPVRVSQADLYASLTNPNNDWYAYFRYWFVTSDGETKASDGFILPQEEKPLIELGTTFTSSKPSVQSLRIGSVRWYRLPRSIRGRYESWQGERIGFLIRHPSFSKDVLIGKETVARVSFLVSNQTAYGYRTPSFVVLLVRGSSVVGVSRATLSFLRAGEEREVSVHWTGPLPTVSRVRVVTDVDPFRADSYLSAGEGTSGTSLRP